MAREVEILDTLQSDLKSFIAKNDDNIRAINKRIDEIEVRMAKPADGGSSEAGSADDIVNLLTSNSDFDTLRRHGKGRAVVEVKQWWPQQKQIVSGSLPAIQRLPGVAIATGRRRLYVRDLLAAYPTDSGAVDYIEETSFTNASSPQVEASAKAESSFVFTPRSVTVRTLAHWCSASKQVLDDVVELRRHVQSALLYGLAVKEEQEILSGDGTGVHQSGLITTATSFDSGLLVPASAGWNKADVLRRAIQQLESSDFDCTGIVVNPVDWADIEVSKSTTYEYAIGDARQSLPLTLWGRGLVVTNSIASGTFLVGDFASGAHIRDRQDGTIDVSDSHDDFFVKNLIALRAESRFALVKTRPAAFVTGSFSTSPA